MKSLVIVTFAVLAACSTAASQNTYKECTTTASTQSELTECGGEDAKRADAELNRVYQELLLKAKGDEHSTAKIRAAQRAWVAFRDAQLSAVFPREDKQAEYGSMYPMCYANVAAEVTRQRTEQLRRMLEKWAPEGAGCWY